MAKQKRKTKKKKKPNNSIKNTYKKVAIGIDIFMLISMVFIYGTNTGFLGDIIKGVYFNIFGIGAYIIPILVFISSLIYILDKYNNKVLKHSIYIYSIFIMTLVIIDLNLNIKEAFIPRITEASYLAALYKGGGFLGSALCYLLLKICGIVGIYLIFIVLVTLFVMSIFDITLKDIYEYIKLVFIEIKNKIKNRKKISKNKVKNKPKEKNKPIKNNFIKEDLEDKSIVINDYKNADTDLSDNKNIEEIEADEDNGEIEDINIQTEESEEYKVPPLELLNTPKPSQFDNKDEVMHKATKIEETLSSFGIESKVVQINRGPTVTCYELQPSQGVKVSRIVNLADDLSLSLATSEIRIEAPIPGKSVVGIEVANENKDAVLLKEIIDSREFNEIESKMPVALGKSISGKPIVSSIDKMPHLLIAGATGSGKSVCINTIIMSILYKASPNDVKLILIDPKVVELSIYNGIPHLAIPVVTDPKKASHALNWAVTEMERRYKIFSENFVRDIKSYNKKNIDNKLEKLPYIVIIIDELSDLMMVSANEVEDAICRLAQMARACGIHLIVATQRPTVDVITGTIKANIPSRISFAVSSQIDSRTILDSSGAEKLLGKGDMLFFPSNLSKPLRVQGCFISDPEVEDIVSYLREENKTQYDETIIEDIDNSVKEEKVLESTDELFEDAVKIILEENSASISLLQRKLKIGYARAGRLIDDMEEQGLISGFEGSKPRKVLISKDYFNKKGENVDEYS